MLSWGAASGASYPQCSGALGSCLPSEGPLSCLGFKGADYPDPFMRSEAEAEAASASAGLLIPPPSADWEGTGASPQLPPPPIFLAQEGLLFSGSFLEHLPRQGLGDFYSLFYSFNIFPASCAGAQGCRPGVPNLWPWPTTAVAYWPPGHVAGWLAGWLVACVCVCVHSQPHS